MPAGLSLEGYRTFMENLGMGILTQAVISHLKIMKEGVLDMHGISLQTGVMDFTHIHPSQEKLYINNHSVKQ